MVKLFSVKEMIALEKEANKAGLTYPEMMENAGRGIAKEIEIAYSHLDNKNIFSIIGSGNNGGDALVALSYLASDGWKTSAYIAGKRQVVDPLIKRLQELGGRIILFENDINYVVLDELLNNNTILIDGVFGTGIKLPLRGDI